MKKYQSRIPKWHVLETDKIIVCETSQPLISLPDDLNNIVYEPNMRSKIFRVQFRYAVCEK